MADYQANQFDGTACGPRNCAAATGAMALADGRNDGSEVISSADFRAESGISCVPGVDTRSGGLRIADVVRVCADRGLTIAYRSGQSIDQLRAHLAAGGGAAVLGDAADAPIHPQTNEVYHSGWVHGYRAAGDETHWHDPRGYVGWVSLAAIETYWRSGDAAQMWAGYVDAVSQPDAGAVPVDDLTGWQATVAAGAAVYRSPNLADQKVNHLSDPVDLVLDSRWSGGWIRDRAGDFFLEADLSNLAAPSAPEPAPPPAPAPITYTQAELDAAIAADRARARVVYD